MLSLIPCCQVDLRMACQCPRRPIYQVYFPKMKKEGFLLVREEQNQNHLQARVHVCRVLLGVVGAPSVNQYISASESDIMFREYLYPFYQMSSKHARRSCSTETTIIAQVPENGMGL